MDTADFIGIFIVGVAVAYLILNSEHSKKSSSKTPVFEKYVQVCPRCGSQNIELDADNFKGFVNYSGKLFYKCNKCGFISQTFIEMIEEATMDFESNREGHWEKPGGWRFKSIKGRDSPSYFLYITTGLVFYMFFGELVIALITLPILRYTINHFESGKYACYGRYEADDEGCLDCNQWKECKKDPL